MSTRSSRKTAKVRFVQGTSQAIKLGSVIAASLQLVALATLVVIALTNTSSPAFFRSMPLLMNALFAILVVSVFVDEEMSDFWSALVFGAVALLVDVIVLIFEIGRWTGAGTAIEFSIVTNFAGQVNIVPVIAIVVTALSLINFVLLVIWMNRRREFLVFQRTLILQNSQSTARQRDRQILDELDRQRDTRNRRVAVSMRDTSKSASMVITVIALVLLIATTVISLIVFEEGAFYRGYFLIFPAILFGAELAFFGTTPDYWIWVSFAFSILAIASCVWGAIMELPRFFDCVLTTLVPVGVLDTNICTNDGWRGYILPWLLVIVGVLSIVQAILLIQMASRGSIFKTKRVAN